MADTIKQGYDCSDAQQKRWRHRISSVSRCDRRTGLPHFKGTAAENTTNKKPRCFRTRLRKRAAAPPPSNQSRTGRACGDPNLRRGNKVGVAQRRA
jgi:hypothetical protein